MNLYSKWLVTEKGFDYLADSEFNKKTSSESSLLWWMLRRKKGIPLSVDTLRVVGSPGKISGIMDSLASKGLIEPAALSETIPNTYKLDITSPKWTKLLEERVDTYRNRTFSEDPQTLIEYSPLENLPGRQN